MNLEHLLGAMTPEIYTRIAAAVESGKWLDGTPLTEEQRENCLQAVLLYQAKVSKTNEHMTIGESGEITIKSKSELRQELRDAQTQPIARFNKDDI